MKDKDSIWSNYIEAELDQRVINYLKGSKDYNELKKQITELGEKYPILIDILEGQEDIFISKEEHEAYQKYETLQHEAERLEKKYHYLMGQADLISYSQILKSLAESPEREVIIGEQICNSDELHRLARFLEFWCLQLRYSVGYRKKVTQSTRLYAVKPSVFKAYRRDAPFY